MQPFIASARGHSRGVGAKEEFCMGTRGRKKQGARSSGGVGPLESRNVVMDGHKRTSIRLEPSMWQALEAIAQREGMTINVLCTMIKDRLEKQRERAMAEPGAKPESAAEKKSTFTSAVRVLIASYFVRAATEPGHREAGHGQGDPFVGTPFDLPRAAGGDSGGGGGGVTGDDPELPAARRPTGMKSRAYDDARYDL